jgi:hypothetical protein
MPFVPIIFLEIVCKANKRLLELERSRWCHWTGEIRWSGLQHGAEEFRYSEIQWTQIKAPRKTFTF